MKKNLKLLILLLFPALLVLFLVRNFAFKKAVAAWFDEAWHYRKSIPVTNNVSQETNVFISVTLDTSDTTKFQTDAGDLRFTKQNGELLPYFISSGVGSTSTIVHVNFDVFPAGSQTIYYYYGNPSAQNGFSASDFSTPASNYTIGSFGSEETGGGPVAYWKFDEGTGTTVYDSSSNKNNGTLGTGSSAPTWQNEDMCVSGKCPYFDGNDYISVNDPSNGSLDFGSGVNFSAGAWFKTGSASDMRILYKYGGGNGYAIFMGSSVEGAGKLAAVIWNSSATYRFGSNKTYNDNKWHYVMITRSGSTLTMYVDGKYENSANTTSADLGNSGVFYIGSDSAPSHFFGGFIDEVKIYPYARTAAQIKEDYNARGASKGVSAQIGQKSASISNGLVGYWNFDVGTGTSAPDLSGNSNTANFGVGDSAPAWVAGNFGIGVSFDGTQEYIEGNISNLPTTGNGTFSFWAERSGNSFGAAISFLISGTTDQYLNIFPYYNATIQLSTAWKSWVYDDTGVSAVAVGQWAHYTFVADTTNLYLYLNGAQIWSAKRTATPSSPTKFRFGNRYYANAPFNGSIDEVRIYNRALSPAEVRQLYDWAPGPIGYWDFNVGIGSSVPDISGNNNNGGWNGTGTHWTTGKFGKAGNFNGTNDYVDAGNGSSLTNLSSITVTAWFKYNSLGQWKGIISKDTNVAGKRGWFLMPSSAAGNPLKFYVNDSSGNQAFVGTWNIVSGSWHYVAGTFDGNTKKLSIYIDGVLNESTTASTIVALNSNNDVNVKIGRWYDANQYFSGQIDEVKIYNYARTQKQIVEDMNAGHPAVGSPVGSAVAHYKFDEGYNTTANNSGNGGSALNGTLGTGSSAPTWTNNGKFGKALSFDGNDYITIGNKSELKTASKTISFWANPGVAFSGTTGVISLSGGNWYVGFSSSGRMMTSHLTSADAQQISYSPNSVVQTGTWQHYVYLFNVDGGNVNISYYVNGKFIETDSYTTGYSSTYGTNAILGAYATNQLFYNGLVDEVKIYNYALTQDEIALDYNRGSAMVLGTLSSGTGNTAPSTAASQEYCVPGDTASCSTPVARWDFEEGSGTSAQDSSGNGNIGTLGTGNSAPTWATGKVGKALKFDGNDYVNIGSPTSLNITGPLTIEAWVKPSSGTGQQGIIGTEVTSAYALYLRHSAGQDIGFWVNPDGTNHYTNIGTVNYDSWNHIVGTWDGTNLKTYLNGLVVSTTHLTRSDARNFQNVTIGYVAGISSPKYINGLIDQVRIYNYARSPAQIAWDYNRGGPVAHWKFDECQGNTVYSSGSTDYSSLTGTINIGASAPQTIAGTCGIGTTNSAWYNGRNGKYNSSLNFDGQDDYVNIGDPTSGIFDITGDITVSAWVKPSLLTGIHFFVSKLYLGEFEIGSNGTILYWRHGNGVNFSNPEWSNYFSEGTGQWYHIVATRNTANTTVTVYKNGKQFGTPQSYTYAPTTSNYSLNIGRRSADSYYTDGQIDDVKIFNYALTATQVKTLYNDGAIRFVQ